MQFFINKLLKFGPEVQIKSLLGHRSQAAAEVRLVSGRHLKDFVDFLTKHTEAFIVIGDRVRLARMPEPKDPRKLLGDDGTPLVGAKAKAAAVDYMKEFLEGQDEVPVPLDALYAQFCAQFPHAVRTDVATNPKELLAFLKLNRHVFFIRSNKVSLVRARLDQINMPDSPPELGENGRSSANTTDTETSTPSQLPTVTLAKTLRHAQVGWPSFQRSSLQSALADLLREPLQQHGQNVVAFDAKFVSLGPQTPEFLSLVCVSGQRLALCR